ncbi:histidine phosphatase family protein [Sphingomonas sp. TZW2008]|uniref:histidine phosphatase family protein n=1 Tax=Sphingomonas sp. TZW2008 TaxID=1917973 RepID=UPI000A26EC01|nr:histidine phosphatase family protein [Sphingomonas sp. TZW2008]
MAHEIILLRHGTHDEVGRVLSGRSEIALNAAGHAQACAAATMLARTPLAAVHTSPRQRCRETAAALGGDACITPALDEIDFGRFAGRSFQALDGDPAWHRWNAERDRFRCPGGETMTEAVDRAAAFLATLPDDDRATLCVTHCDIIRGLVVRALGLSFDRMFALPCDPGSLTRLTLEHGALRLVTLNVRPSQFADQ